ncbi:MAG: hypothetical protein KF708_18575 [Pirellulales bacterium]|nr:hypothetical protein [Pirellulales bacterium]
MWRDLLDRFKRNDSFSPIAPFQPLYSLEQLAAIARLPIVYVLAFAGDGDETNDQAVGPGVGGILASLLRRDLGFTRRCSVVGGEDTGYLYPNGFDTHDAELLDQYAHASAIVCGQIRTQASGGLSLQIRIVRRNAVVTTEDCFSIQATPDQLSRVMPTIATAVSKRLGFSVSADVAQRWRRHTATDWNHLRRAAVCWERGAVPALAEMLRAGHIHPDATAAVDCEGAHRKTAREALARANELEPDNAQLAFLTFCTFCNFNVRPVEPRFETMLRRGLAAMPGHGKSHMVLPHILDRLTDNVPYILAHSEAGYRLLPGNSFSLSNFSTYLSQLAPHDSRIEELALQAIRLDPENPFGYRDAIDFYLAGGEGAKAIKVASALLELCTPPIADRTWYCFRQAPSLAKLIDAQRFNPTQYALSLVKQCRVAT